MVAKLIVLNGKQAGQSFSLTTSRDNLLGREEHCVLSLEDPACSRTHANIWHESDRWQLADRVSANGTFLNGERIESSDLRDGDKILIGGTWLRFVQLSGDNRHGDQPGGAPTWILEDSINPATSLTAISPSTATSERREDLDCLERVSTEIARETDPIQLAESTLAIITDHLRAAGAKLFWHKGRSVLAEYQRSAMPEVSEEIVQQALATAEAVLVPNVDGKMTARSIFAPLKYLDHAVGVIWVAETLGRTTFKHEDLCLVASIAHVLAPPLKMLLDVKQLQRKNESLLEGTNIHVIGRSPEMQRVLQLVARVADVDQTVLIRGESGVGKEVIAKLIHETGIRREQPMVCVNCAALTESILESELFGHEKGAFTGATDLRPGKFEMADSGTIFLDEIGCMSPSIQAKLLRILDGHPFERVGGHQPIHVNVRVLAATNADLEDMVTAGDFREDLYHRLRVIEIPIPALAERHQDIPDLANYFLHRFCEQTGKHLAFAPDALSVLDEHDWPGNVRQLRNAIERAAILSNDTTITPDHLRAIAFGGTELDRVMPIDELNRSGIERAIIKAGSVPEAAKTLGMSRSALYRHMKKLQITPPRLRAK